MTSPNTFCNSFKVSVLTMVLQGFFPNNQNCSLAYFLRIKMTITVLNCVVVQDEMQCDFGISAVIRDTCKHNFFIYYTQVMITTINLPYFMYIDFHFPVTGMYRPNCQIAWMHYWNFCYVVTVPAYRQSQLADGKF